MTTDIVITRRNTNPANRTHDVLGRPLSAYQRYPERASWCEWETRQKADGTTYTVVRDCDRWGQETVRSEWRLV
jgi:hypothetical protein